MAGRSPNAVTSILRRIWSTTLGPPILLVLIALLPRLCAAAFSVTPARDMVRYIEGAEALRTLPLAEAIRVMDCHPLYPAALSVAQTVLSQYFGVTGPMSWVVAGEVVGVVCYMMFLLASYAVGGKVWNRTIAFWGCAIVALLPRQVSYSVDVLTDSLHAWLWMTCLYFLMEVDRPNPGWRYALAGLFAGLAYWTRAEALLLPILAFSGGAVIQLVPQWRIPWRSAAVCALAFGVMWTSTAGTYIGTLGRLSKRNSAAALTGQSTTAEPIVAPSSGLTTIGETVVPPVNATPTILASDVGSSKLERDAAINVADERVELPTRPYVGDEAYEIRPFSRAVVAYAYEIAQETRVWMLPFVFWGLVASRRKFTQSFSIFWVIAWAGYSAMLILLQMKCGYIAGRYLMPLMPNLGMLAAAGIGRFIRLSVIAPTWLESAKSSLRLTADPKRRRSLAVAVVVIVAVATSVPAWFRSNHRHRQTYIEAAAWIKDHTQSGEAVFDPINLVSFYADRPNWRPTHPDQPITVRFAVVDVERVYRTDLCSHGVIKRFNAVGKPVAKFVQSKSHREGVVYILEWPGTESAGAKEGKWR